MEMRQNNESASAGIRIHTSVDIEEEESLASTIKVKMEQKSPSLCIYRIPENLLKLSRKSYIPDIVSIGPFHRDPSLSSMEDHKWRYLHELLGRNPLLEETLDQCVKFIRQLEERARKCYYESEKFTLSSDQFVEMLLVDGCFIIELFFKYILKGLRRKGDPVFNNRLMISGIRRDLLLLENQIPLFVLQRLYEIVPIPNQLQRQSLSQIAFRFFKTIIPGNKEALENKFVHEGGHLLDLLRQCFLPSLQRVMPPENQRASNEHMNSAKKLQKTGIEIKKSVRDSLLDLTFVRGELRIPPLKIYDFTESVLRNLIALEQCCLDYSRQISSYALLMSNLIRTQNDVKLLEQKGIIANHLGTHEEVSSLFTHLSKEIKVEEFYYVDLCQQVNSYCSSNLHGQWTKLKRVVHPYFLLLLGFLVLFSFTGTVFSILSFTLRRS